MNNQPPLEPDNYYHIYNRGINSCKIFEEENDYSKFLELLDKYILPVANIYAFVLMPNHFHLLIRIKDDIIYQFSNADRLNNAVGFEKNKWETIPKPDSVEDLSAFKTPNASKHLSHLFNSYSKYFNTKINRHGTLFERPFKRKLIDSEDYLKQVLIYIHNNPIHHGFCAHQIEYPWSSYLDFTNNKATKLKRNEVIEWFGDLSNFDYCHKNTSNTESLTKYLNL